MKLQGLKEWNLLPCIYLYPYPSFKELTRRVIISLFPYFKVHGDLEER